MAVQNFSLGTDSVPIYGFYRAMVIANNDPENRGRVKLFSPSVASSLMTHFKLDPGEYAMRFPGDTINGQKQLNNTLDSITTSLRSKSQFKNFSLKQIHTIAGVLDWVDQASPLIGSGTIGQVNALSGVSFISDVPVKDVGAEKVTPRSNSSEANTGLQTKSPGIVNPNAYLNTPAGYINAAKGMFSVPRVGSTVWVFFEEGDVTRPIYFAYSFSSTEFSTIYNDIHAPSTSENSKDGDPLYTGKTVLASKGGVLEIVDTDDFEKIRISDHKGNTVTLSKLGISFKSINNLNIEVAGDVHQTVGGRYVSSVKGEHHSSSGGYGHEIHGDIDVAAPLQKEWLEKSQQVRDTFTLPKEAPKHATTAKKDFQKKTPNNKFCFPKVLNFKLPKGLDPKVFLEKINKVLNKLNKVINLPLILLEGAEDLVGDVMDLLKNPFNFLLTMLKNRIKLLGIKLCNDKKK